MWQTVNVENFRNVFVGWVRWPYKAEKCLHTSCQTVWTMLPLSQGTTKLLLSTVYNQFMNLISTFPNATSASFTSRRWLLSQLSLKLQPHILFTYRCHKIGAVIYRNGGDLLYSLIYALGQVEHLNKVVHCTLEENKILRSKKPSVEYCTKVIISIHCYSNRSQIQQL